jgi:hypothetical protein
MGEDGAVFPRWFWRENAFQYSDTLEAWRPFSRNLEIDLELKYQRYLSNRKSGDRGNGNSSRKPASSSVMDPTEDRTAVLLGKFLVDFELMSLSEKLDQGSRRSIQRILVKVDPRWYVEFPEGTRMLGERLSQTLDYYYCTGFRSCFTLSLNGDLLYLNLDHMTALSLEACRSEFEAFCALHPSQSESLNSFRFCPKPLPLKRQTVLLRQGGAAGNPYKHPLLDERALLESEGHAGLSVVDVNGVAAQFHRGLLPDTDPAGLATEDLHSTRWPTEVCRNSACTLHKASSRHIFLFRHACPFGRLSDCWLAKEGSPRAIIHTQLFTHDNLADHSFVTDAAKQWRRSQTVSLLFRQSWSSDVFAASMSRRDGSSKQGVSPSTTTLVRILSPIPQALHPGLESPSSAAGKWGHTPSAQSEPLVLSPSSGSIPSGSYITELHNVHLGTKEGQTITGWFEKDFEFLNRYPRVQRIENGPKYQRYIRRRNELQELAFEKPLTVLGKPPDTNSEQIGFAVIQKSTLHSILSGDLHRLEIFSTAPLAVAAAQLANQTEAEEKALSSGPAPSTANPASSEDLSTFLLVVLVYFYTCPFDVCQKGVKPISRILPPLDSHIFLENRGAVVYPFDAVLDGERRSTSLYNPDQWYPMYLVTCQSRLA